MITEKQLIEQLRKKVNKSLAEEYNKMLSAEGTKDKPTGLLNFVSSKETSY